MNLYRYTKPERLDLATDSDNENVVGFVVGMVGYGEVAFDVDEFNVTDVRNLDLRDSLVWEGTPVRFPLPRI